MKNGGSILMVIWLSMVGIANAGDAQVQLPANLGADSATIIVSGKISKANPAYFDLATLMQLKSTAFQTSNRWTSKMDRHKGVAFIDLLVFLGVAPGATVVDVIASKDYKTSIRIADLKGTIICWLFNSTAACIKTIRPNRTKVPSPLP